MTSSRATREYLAMTVWRLVVGFAHRLAYATLVSIAAWYLYIVPFPMTPLPHGLHMALLRVFDLPVAIVNIVLPWQLQGIDVFAAARQPESANILELLHVHLRVSVPTYVLLFYGPTTARRARDAFKRWNARRSLRP